MSTETKPKTKTVYHFLNERYGLDAIRDNRIKISRFTELNDPFEYYAVELSNERVRKWAKEEKESISKDRGLICFSDTWEHPLMWSHYADSHKGICLGFDVPEEYSPAVKYTRDRIPVSESLESILDGTIKGKSPEYKNKPRKFILDLNRQMGKGWGLSEKPVGCLNEPEKITKELSEFMQDLLGTKCAYWHYEKESRMWVDLPSCEKENGIYFSKFSDLNLKLKEVIMGANAENMHPKVLAALCNRVDKVNIRKVRVAFKSFKVVDQQDKNLW